MAGATIYDVATAAGVSIKTVSRVVNGEPNVSPALKERVDKAVADLGYRRSLSARSLAGASSSIIAALVDAELTIEHWRSGRGNDYLSRLELGALMEVRQADYHLMVELVDHASPTLQRDLSALIASIRPAGVLLTPPNSDHSVVLDVLDAAGVAYARIGSEKELHRGVNVSMDERSAARDMTLHLIELGHRRIGFVTGPVTYAASQRRLQGFRDAMAAHDLEIAASAIAEGDFTFPSGVSGAERILDAVPDVTAIFASNDDTALGVLQAARARGLKTPDDLSVAGFDDTPSAMFSTPALTTIRQPVAEMAAAAARRLTPVLSAGLPADEAGQVVIVPYALVVRDSTGAPPIRS
ncbi:LacI family DNA-binding transcriptional regulator [soil metagenome]